MEIEDRVECRIVNNSHVATAAHQAMYLIMNRLNTVIITAATGWDPGFIAEIGVVGVCCEKVVQSVAERQSVVVKLLRNQVVLTGGSRIGRRGGVPKCTRPGAELLTIN